MKSIYNRKSNITAEPDERPLFANTNRLKASAEIFHDNQNAV